MRRDDDKDFASAVRNVLVALVGSIEVIAVMLMLNDGGVLPISQWWESVGPWWVNDGWPWTSAWLTSPGFGGMAAVVAAALALAGARHQARLNAWWQRVEWAVTLYVNPKATEIERRTGASALEYLQESRLARSDEKGFVGAVVEAVTLDPLGNGLSQDDWSQSVPTSFEAQESATGDKTLSPDAGQRPVGWRRMVLRWTERLLRQKISD